MGESFRRFSFKLCKFSKFMVICNCLCLQLAREKELLHAMMQHLHLKPLRDREEQENREAEKRAAAEKAAVRT